MPLCALAFASGVFLSLGTPWGLVRHYWLAFKLAITVVSSALLWLHLRPITQLAVAGASVTTSLEAYRPQRVQMVVVSGAAVVALLVATALSVMKPAGLTPYGWRRLRQPTAAGT